MKIIDFSLFQNPNLLPRNMDKTNGQDENRDTLPIDKKVRFYFFFKFLVKLLL